MIFDISGEINSRSHSLHPCTVIWHGIQRPQTAIARLCNWYGGYSSSGVYCRIQTWTRSQIDNLILLMKRWVSRYHKLLSVDRSIAHIEEHIKWARISSILWPGAMELWSSVNLPIILNHSISVRLYLARIISIWLHFAASTGVCRRHWLRGKGVLVAVVHSTCRFSYRLRVIDV